MRFDKTESPDYINGGKGWRQPEAAQWLIEHGLDGDAMLTETSYIRAKQYEAGKYIEAHTVDTGVVAIRCERKD